MYLVGVAENPKGTPASLRLSIACIAFLYAPLPLLSSVSFSKPSTEIPGATFPSSASFLASPLFIKWPFVYTRKYMSLCFLYISSISFLINGSPPEIVIKYMPISSFASVSKRSTVSIGKSSFCVYSPA